MNKTNKLQINVDSNYMPILDPDYEEIDSSTTPNLGEADYDEEAIIEKQPKKYISLFTFI